MEQLKGSWTAHYGEDYCTIYDANNDEVLTSPCYSEVDKGTFDLIVACVNACEGINPEVVPDLLEALELANSEFQQLLLHPDMLPKTAVLETIRAAIAK